jgi:hypothetical protein
MVAHFHDTVPKHSFALSATGMETGGNATKTLMKIQDKSETDSEFVILLLHNAHKHTAAYTEDWR